MHCVKSVQIRSFFWSVFSRIRTEYEKIRTRKNSVFGHISHSDGLQHARIVAPIKSQQLSTFLLLWTASKLKRFFQEKMIWWKKQLLNLVRKKINIWLNMSKRSSVDLPNLGITSQYLQGYISRLSMMQRTSADETACQFNVFMVSGSPKIWLKSGSHLQKKKIICFSKSPLKIMKNAFYFILKALFVLKIFNFVLTFWSCIKR